ncbi:MAG: hypothetical protein KatS3mg102_0719 [Planctomycetota bacterium]|nr:MAG: hypothetical protein KatS3mg102_0719 [Planctomycetota bacterium]
MIRNRRRECLVQFPERVAHSFHVTLDDEAREAYGDLVRECKRLGRSQGIVRATFLQLFCSSYSALDASLQKSSSGHQLNRDTFAALVRREHFKLRALREKILPMLEGQKTLIFCQYRETQREVFESLRRDGHHVATICGVSGREKTQRILRFKQDPDAHLLICNSTASEGLNLQFCSALVNYDLPWNPMRLEQRIGRIQRLGAVARRIHIFNLFAKGTIEDFLFEVLDKRLHLFSESIGVIEQVLGRLEEGESFEALVFNALFEDDFESYARKVGQRLAKLREQNRKEEEQAASILDAFELDALFDDVASDLRARGL